MTYELIFAIKARESLQSLPKEISGRVFDRLVAARENPVHFFERLSGRSDYKLRIGDYRAIADIDHAAKRIEVTVVDHRKRVYKNLPEEK